MLLERLEREQPLAIAAEFVDSLDQRLVVLSQKFRKASPQFGVRAAKDKVGQVNDRCATPGNLPVQELELLRVLFRLQKKIQLSLLIGSMRRNSPSVGTKCC